jgi:hypothetical protein
MLFSIPKSNECDSVIISGVKISLEILPLCCVDIYIKTFNVDNG